MKNHISILEGFWEGFGRVLGGQNPQFSNFFQCFFDVNFRVQLDRAKNREKMSKNNPDLNFEAVLRSVRTWGEGF